MQAFPNFWCGNYGIYTVLMYFNQLIFSTLALSVCQVLFPFKVALYSFFLAHEEQVRMMQAQVFKNNFKTRVFE